MLTSDKERVDRAPASYTPKYAPLPAWGILSGIGRSKTYEMLGEGTLRAIKVGGRLLIDVEHGLSVLAAMPQAEIHVASRAKRPKHS